MTGGPNEVWAFGDEAYGIIREVMQMRERLRPYLHAQLDRASEEGLPAMRPLFVDFPDDDRAWAVDDQFMFGSDVLVAPVLEPGARGREVYLPAGRALDPRVDGGGARGRLRRHRGRAARGHPRLPARRGDRARGRRIGRVGRSIPPSLRLRYA